MYNTASGMYSFLKKINAESVDDEKGILYTYAQSYVHVYTGGETCIICMRTNCMIHML